MNLISVGKPASLALVTAFVVSGAAFAQQVIYDSLPTPLPPNVASVGFEATSTAEFGDQIRFATGGRSLADVIVTMSSWACQSGGDATCVTTPGSTFQHPITLNIYSVKYVGSIPATDQLIATKTTTFSIPFRPTSNCPTDSTAWLASDGSCYHGKAFDIAFDLSSLGVMLPDDVIWGIAYNTSNHGSSPLNVAGPYDSLNVGLSTAATVGIDVDPNSVFWNTSVPSFYCDGGVAGSGIFRFDGGCWTGLVPAAQFNAMAACPSGAKVSARWHYSANNSPGGWSGSKSTNCQDGSIVIGPQAMEGDLKIAPGTTLKVGYDFTLPGNKTDYSVQVGGAQVVFQARCVSGAAPAASSFAVAIPSATYSVIDQSWYPSGDQKSALVYQASIVVPNLCAGGQVRLDKGGTFTADVLLF